MHRVDLRLELPQADLQTTPVEVNLVLGRSAKFAQKVVTAILDFNTNKETNQLKRCSWLRLVARGSNVWFALNKNAARM